MILMLSVSQKYQLERSILILFGSLKKKRKHPQNGAYIKKTP